MNNNKLPKVSICCITYNHEKFCKEAIRSIWNQDYQNIEIIVIEDGSTDNTYKILSDLAKISPFLMKVLTQKNTYNIGLNLNKTLKESTGELIMFLSLDDKYCSNVVSKLVKKISENNENQIVVSDKFIKINDKSEIFNRYDSFSYNSYKKQITKSTIDEILELETLGGSFWLCNAIYRKDIIDKVNGFDEDLIGDDIVLRTKLLQYMIKNKFGKIDFLDDFVLQYRSHETNISQNSERQCQILYEVLERYFNGKNSKTLDNWICGTILKYTLKRKLYDAFRMMFFDKKNKNKIGNLFNINIMILKIILQKIYKLFKK